MTYSYCSIATPREMAVIKAIFVREPEKEIGTANSDVNPIYPISTRRPEQWDEHWSALPPFNKQERIILARKIIDAVMTS